MRIDTGAEPWVRRTPSPMRADDGGHRPAGQERRQHSRCGEGRTLLLQLCQQGLPAAPGPAAQAAQRQWREHRRARSVAFVGRDGTGLERLGDSDGFAHAERPVTASGIPVASIAVASQRSAVSRNAVTSGLSKAKPRSSSGWRRRGPLELRVARQIERACRKQPAMHAGCSPAV